MIGICDAKSLSPAIKYSDVGFMKLKSRKDDESSMKDYDVFRKEGASLDKSTLTNDPHELDNIP
jgi:hypothetical protein